MARITTPILVKIDWKANVVIGTTAGGHELWRNPIPAELRASYEALRKAELRYWVACRCAGHIRRQARRRR